MKTKENQLYEKENKETEMKCEECGKELAVTNEILLCDDCQVVISAQIPATYLNLLANLDDNVFEHRLKLRDDA